MKTEIGINEISFQKIDLDKDEIFSRYLKNIGEKFCPYLIPAHDLGVLFQSEFFLDDQNLLGLHEEIFLRSLFFVEHLRRFRLDHAASPEALFACHNLVFHTKQEAGLNGEKILEWPHWLLKLLYTDTGIMFGKFWIDENLTSRKNIPIPSSPVNFISIRSAIREKDPYFFKKVPELLPALMNSLDDGQNVHGNFLDRNITEFTIGELKNLDYYNRLKIWALHKLKEKNQ